jgi:cytochrome c peroxidase
MNTKRTVQAVFAVAATSLVFLATAGQTTGDEPRAHQLTFANRSGVQRTITMADTIDIKNPFFQDLGTNGRTCFSCHRPAQAWTITPEEIQQRFDETAGLDPVFRNNDGSNCEGADVSTLAMRRRAFSQLLTKGLIRIGLAVPDSAEFEIVEADDPYDCGAPLTQASMFRRPLPTTNLGFLSTVMWDGRETVKGQAIRSNLLTQASDATTTHAQGVPPSPAQLEQIVAFELGLFTAQTHDNGAGSLRAHDATGGPRPLSTEPFCIGINDPLNILPDMPGACETSSGGLDPNVFTIFSAWERAKAPERQAIARGQLLFNTREFVIDNVGGLNGAPEDPVGTPLRATCTICHDTPNAGNHSISMPLNIGLAVAARRTPDLPLYTLRNKATLETVQTTDPGRAMVTGKWADVGKFKGPILRALAARAPYFHNGAAATLEEAVDFYDTRFNIGLTAREKADLVAFLKAL